MRGATQELVSRALFDRRKKAPPERGKLGELLRELSVFNDSFLHLAEGRVNFFVIGLT